MRILLCLSILTGSLFVSAPRSSGADPYRWSIVVQEPDGRCAMYPDVIRLKNGDVLCAYYSQKWEMDTRRYPKFAQEHLDVPRENSRTGGQIRYVRSTDSGRTWSESKILGDTPWDDRLHNGLAQLSDGTLLCAWFVIWDWPARCYENTPAGEDDQYALFISRSTDDGRSWSKPRRVVDRPKFHVGCGSHIRELSDGTLLWVLYYYDTQGASELHALSVRSTDKGKTWGEDALIGPRNSRLEEADILELKDGRVMVVIDKSRSKGVVAYSSDKGRTWSESAMHSLAFGIGAPALLRTSKGSILLSYSDNLSRTVDGGKSWSEPISFGGPGHYARIVELPDGTFLDVNHESGPWSRIRQVHFKFLHDGKMQIIPTDRLVVATARLAEGRDGVNYSTRLSAWGGRPPYHWRLGSGKVPAGLRLVSSTGVIYGKMERSGNFPLTIQVIDATGAIASRKLTLTCVTPPASQ